MTAVITTIDGPLARITLNRPAAFNALDPDMIAGLHTALDQIEAAEGLRAVVLTGAGEAFMAGGDVSWFARLVAENPPDREDQVAAMIDRVHQIIKRLVALPLPVVAAVNGACAGFGVSLMLACDLSIAKNDAVFAMAYANIGISPDGGLTWSLPRAVGLSRALHLALLSDRIDATEAQRLGLIGIVAPVDGFAEALDKLLKKLANGPTLAYARTKRLLRGAAMTGLESQLDAEAAAFATGTGSADFASGVTAFVNRQKPNFTGK